MSPRGPALAVLAVALLAASCGGGDDDDRQVTDALNAFLADHGANDGAGMCRRVTAESRRMLATLSSAGEGLGTECADTIEERLAEAGDDGLARVREAVDDAEVEVDGDTAEVSPPGTDGSLTLRRDEGEWLVDLGDLPQGVGYSLQASAVCTEDILRSQRLPLPAPTRDGIAGEAERQAEQLARLRRLAEKLGPPPGKEEAHDTYVGSLRADEADLRRAARGLRGLAAPVATYNRVLRAAARRVSGLREAQEALRVSCLGYVDTRPAAIDYVISAGRICARTRRRLDRLPPPETRAELRRVARRAAAVGRAASDALKRLAPPPELASLHRRSVEALRAFYAGLVRTVRARDPRAEQERSELRQLRSTMAFQRIGLQRCGQL